MFTKYSSITNAYKDSFITKCFMETAPETIFIATEKLHGTNFSFLVSKNKIKHCSRNNVLNYDTKFFNHRSLDKYHDKLRKLYNLINVKKINDGELDCVIQVYGEYVGPGVQKGIDYGEEDFYLFDIKVNGKYIPFTSVIYYSDVLDFKLVPVIYVGTLEECLQQDNDFNSRILFKADNVCEGVVIKPLDEVLYLPTGERLIIKNKNDKWAEKAKMPKRIKNPLTANVKNQLAELTPFVTENRVNNVISKDVMWQDIDNSKFGKLIQAVIEDICEEAEKTEEDIKPIKKFLSREVAKVVRSVCFS